MIKSYQDLDVWRSAMDLAVEIYELTKDFPGDEKYGLTSQLRRAVVSIPSNIAEGYRGTRPNYARHCRLAHGSLAEVETQMALAYRLSYLRQEKYIDVASKLDELSRRIYRLIQKLDEPRS